MFFFEISLIVTRLLIPRDIVASERSEGANSPKTLTKILNLKIAFFFQISPFTSFLTISSNTSLVSSLVGQRGSRGTCLQQQRGVRAHDGQMVTKI